MKRVRSVAACGVITVAMGGALAASAPAALPEFSGPFPKLFTSKSGTVIGETVSVPHEMLVCSASTDKGEILGAKAGRLSMRLTGCLGEDIEQLPCKTPGAAEEEIVTTPLAMTVGYISKAKREVGVALEPIPSVARPVFTEFECAEGFAHFMWEGSVIGKLTSAGKKGKPAERFTLNFTEAKGKQKPSKLEGGMKDVLIGHGEIGGGEPKETQIGLSAKDELAFTEAVEVKA